MSPFFFRRPLPTVVHPLLDPPSPSALSTLPVHPLGFLSVSLACPVCLSCHSCLSLCLNLCKWSLCLLLCRYCIDAGGMYPTAGGGRRGTRPQAALGTSGRSSSTSTAWSDVGVVSRYGCVSPCIRGDTAVFSIFDAKCRCYSSTSCFGVRGLIAGDGCLSRLRKHQPNAPQNKNAVFVVPRLSRMEGVDGSFSSAGWPVMLHVLFCLALSHHARTFLCASCVSCSVVARAGVFESRPSGGGGYGARTCQVSYGGRRSSPEEALTPRAGVLVVRRRLARRLPWPGSFGSGH